MIYNYRMGMKIFGLVPETRNLLSEAATPPGEIAFLSRGHKFDISLVSIM